MLHIPPTNLLLRAAKQEPYKKAYLLMKNIEEFSGKSSEERTSRQKKKRDKLERVTGLDRRTREEIAKWNQMTTLRFQTGGETPDIPGLPSGIKGENHTTDYHNLLMGENQNVPYSVCGTDLQSWVPSANIS